jgi:hypothetical protein
MEISRRCGEFQIQTREIYMWIAPSGASCISSHAGYLFAPSIVAGLFLNAFLNNCIAEQRLRGLNNLERCADLPERCNPTATDFSGRDLSRLKAPKGLAAG